MNAVPPIRLTFACHSVKNKILRTGLPSRQCAGCPNGPQGDSFGGKGWTSPRSRRRAFERVATTSETCDWIDDWDEATKLTLQGRYLETGEKMKSQRTKASYFDTGKIEKPDDDKK